MKTVLTCTEVDRSSDRVPVLRRERRSGTKLFLKKGSFHCESKKHE